MDISTASVEITGISPYSQSFKHDEPPLNGESPDAYDARTWRSKMTTTDLGKRRSVAIPAFGLHLALMDAAKYSKRKIPGQRGATWTAKFRSGLGLPGPGILDIDPDTVKCVAVSVNADGVRGSGKRVTRRFPQIPAGWTAHFDVQVFDPIITVDVFQRDARTGRYIHRRGPISPRQRRFKRPICRKIGRLGRRAHPQGCVISARHASAHNNATLNIIPLYLTPLRLTEPRRTPHNNTT